ncbi:hypothetical protein BOX15_Mlig010601g1 [Macrostomum lignano]|uniref:Uncharacterized protein n=2 Tax=Macrostomum lignano TaxID=282301 RepID=A0A267F125_9PLAT|nr:hypothetical protein BOX15_Mlig010601g1 [Macrostomum lignano]
MGCSPSRNVSQYIEVIASKSPDYLCRSTEVKHSVGVLFDVKGFSDAVISLCGPQEMVDYEATIGAFGNSRCLLRSTLDPEVVAHSNTPSLLNQTDYRQMWLTWRQCQLCLGDGPRAGLSKYELLSLPIAAVQSASGAAEAYRPFCLKVSCPTAGSRVCFRNPRLLFEGDI